jgi:LuxR family transcriptional regulator, maltose regulon positive regulatory protein
MRPPGSRIDAGWAHLRAGRWAEARDCFRDAGDSAEALEGLAWTAWWLDDEPTVFAAREAAYRAYRDARDTAGAARMATWLGIDELDFHGAAAVTAGWLRRARRLLEPLEPGPDHGWLAFHEGYLAHAGGDSATACERAAAAAELGRTLGVADLEMLGLALRGAALVSCAEIEEGMRDLDEAAAVALEGDAAIPISSAWTCCFVVTACTAVLDFERAAAWCDRIAEFADRYGSRYMLAFCRAEYGAVHLWRGRWAEAEATLSAAHEDYARSRPAWSGGPLAALAELRRRQGRTADAEALLARAGAASPVQLCRARLTLDRGHAVRAAELLDRLLRKLPRDRRLARAPALELLVSARTACGDLDAAAAALAELRAVERSVDTAPLRACADRAEGILAAGHGDHERARTLLEDAVDGFETAGAPYEAASTRLELVASLLALGRGDAAADEARAARDALVALGAVSDAARAERLLGDGPLPELTAREREVLRLLAEGLTNRGIAERLVLSEHTVHRHVTNMLRKLGLPSRTAAAAVAVRSGLARE